MGDEDPSPHAPDVPLVEVPDVVGFDAIDACEMLRTTGLVPHGTDENTTPDTGVVLTQNPAANASATIGDTVTLQTDAGPMAPD